MASLKENKNLRMIINTCLLMIVIILAFTLSIKLYKTYKENKLSQSVLSRTIGTIQYEDIDSAKNEFTGNTFILISYLKSKETRNFEKDIKKIIIKNNLETNFYYIDATELKLNENFLDNINKKFNLNNNTKINNIPAIIYIENGVVKDSISSKNNKILNSKDFNNLLIKNNIIESK